MSLPPGAFAHQDDSLSIEAMFTQILGAVQKSVGTQLRVA